MIKKNFINAYLAGFLLGLLLLGTFIFAQRGLGASGFFTVFSAKIFDTVAINNAYFSSYTNETSFFDQWIIYEILGVFLGALISAKISGRFNLNHDQLINTSKLDRYLLALLGGLLMGFASRLARGCTSGQALSGGALLSLGSWIYMIFIFIGGYLTIAFKNKVRLR